MGPLSSVTFQAGAGGAPGGTYFVNATSYPSAPPPGVSIQDGMWVAVALGKSGPTGWYPTRFRWEAMPGGLAAYANAYVSNPVPLVNASAKAISLGKPPNMGPAWQPGVGWGNPILMPTPNGPQIMMAAGPPMVLENVYGAFPTDPPTYERSVMLNRGAFSTGSKGEDLTGKNLIPFGTGLGEANDPGLGFPGMAAVTQAAGLPAGQWIVAGGPDHLFTFVPNGAQPQAQGGGAAIVQSGLGVDGALLVAGLVVAGAAAWYYYG
jgi:hypothetical protein